MSGTARGVCKSVSGRRQERKDLSEVGRRQCRGRGREFDTEESGPFMNCRATSSAGKRLNSEFDSGRLAEQVDKWRQAAEELVCTEGGEGIVRVMVLELPFVCLGIHGG